MTDMKAIADVVHNYLRDEIGPLVGRVKALEKADTPDVAHRLDELERQVHLLWLRIGRDEQSSSKGMAVLESRLDRMEYGGINYE